MNCPMLPRRERSERSERYEEFLTFASAPVIDIEKLCTYKRATDWLELCNLLWTEDDGATYLKFANSIQRAVLQRRLVLDNAV